MFLCDMMPRTKCQLYLWTEEKNDLMGGDRNKKKDQYTVIRIRFFFLNLVSKYHHIGGNDTESPLGPRGKL